MRARTFILRGLAAAGLALALAACGGGSSAKTPSSGSGGSNSANGGGGQAAIPKVTPPATPPSLPAAFPIGDWKNARSEIVFDKNGTAKVSLAGRKTGTTLYTVSGNSINFGADDAGVCDSPATYDYALAGDKLTLTLTTVDLCSPRSADFTVEPYTKG